MQRGASTDTNPLSQGRYFFLPVRSVTVVFGCRATVEAFTKRPVIALRCILPIAITPPFIKDFPPLLLLSDKGQVLCWFERVKLISLRRSARSK